MLRSVRATHQYLAKPCNPEQLQTIVRRACAVKELLAQETLRKLIGGIQSLPSLPALDQELLDELRLPDPSLKKVAQIIAQDLGMTSKILQVINSPFFWVRRRISDPFQAVTYLGLEQVKALALMVNVFSQFTLAPPAPVSLEQLWKHSLATSTLARAIAQAEGAPQELVDQAVAAGLLHDLGILVLVANQPQLVVKVLTQASHHGKPVYEIEQEHLGTTHAAIGAYLLGLWGLEDPVVEAVAFHHHPARFPGYTFSPLTAVHVANALVHECLEAAWGTVPSCIDPDYLTALGLADRLPRWRELSRVATSMESKHDGAHSVCG